MALYMANWSYNPYKWSYDPTYNWQATHLVGDTFKFMGDFPLQFPKKSLK